MSTFAELMTSDYPPHREFKTEIDAHLYFVKERKAMLVRKEAGEQPCTEDPLLSHYRWTNVERERDYCTGWFRRNIRERHVDDADLWWMLSAARALNWPPTFHKLMSAEFMGGVTWPSHPKFSIDNFEKGLRKVQSAG